MPETFEMRCKICKKDVGELYGDWCPDCASLFLFVPVDYAYTKRRPNLMGSVIRKVCAVDYSV